MEVMKVRGASALGLVQRLSAATSRPKRTLLNALSSTSQLLSRERAMT